MQLQKCEDKVQAATAELQRFAKQHELRFTPLQDGFWIRDSHGRGIFQGNYAKQWLRPFMPNVTPSELAKLSKLGPVRYKNRYQDGYRFYVQSQADLATVEKLILERCGK
jgi:predicted acylesterase/phospholipase RssA